MNGLLHDVRYALRGLGRNPGFTAVAVLTLALGIGANTAVFTLVNAVYLKKLPIHDPERFVQMTGEQWFGTGVWEHVRDHQRVFERVAAAGVDRFNLARGGVARYATSLVVSGDFFETLGLVPALGRFITRADDRPGAPAVVVVSYGFWQRQLAGKPDAIGDVVWVEDEPFEIIGVTPREFVGVEVGRSVDVIVPMASLAAIPSRAIFLQPTAVWLHIFARLRPGQTFEQATTAIRA